MSDQTLTPEEISFLQSLRLDANSADLKAQIQNLMQTSSSFKQNSGQIASTQSKTGDLSQILTKIYTQIIPELQKNGQTWDIDYDFDRKENKRYESLKKRGCSQIIKVSLEND